MADEGGLDPTLWQRTKRWFSRVWSWLTGRNPGDEPEVSPRTPGMRRWRDEQTRSPSEDEAPEAKPVETTRVTVQPEPTYVTFETPARGDAFNLLIQVRVSWSAQKTSGDSKKKKEAIERELNDSVDRIRQGLEPTLQEEVRDIVRNFPPHRPAEAEFALREQLPMTVCHGDGDVECHRRFFVTLVEPVRRKLEEPAFQMLALDLRGDLSVAQSEVMTRARRAWQEFLQSGLDDLKPTANGERPNFNRWLAPWAVDLAENPVNIGERLRVMHEQRSQDVKYLFDEVHRMTINQSELDILDFSLKHDTALRALFDAMMVNVDPARPDSPFATEES